MISEKDILLLFINKDHINTSKGTHLYKVRHYIAQSKIFVYTIHLDIRSYVIQDELGEGKARCVLES